MGIWMKQDWPDVDDCGSLAMGSLRLMMLFSLVLCTIEASHVNK